MKDKKRRFIHSFRAVHSRFAQRARKADHYGKAEDCCLSSYIEWDRLLSGICLSIACYFVENTIDEVA